MNMIEERCGEPPSNWTKRIFSLVEIGDLLSHGDPTGKLRKIKQISYSELFERDYTEEKMKGWLLKRGKLDLLLYEREGNTILLNGNHRAKICFDYNLNINVTGYVHNCKCNDRLKLGEKCNILEKANDLFDKPLI